MVKWQRIGLNQRSCATLGLVTTWQLAWLGLKMGHVHLCRVADNTVIPMAADVP